MSSSDSDSEFDKFLQESLSSTISTVSGITPPLLKGKRPHDNNKEGEGEVGKTAATTGQGTLSSIGLSWLKSDNVIEDDEDEWIKDQTRPTSSNNKRKTSTTSVGDDPLNFSTGSSYSIISEIEHQLGLRGNKTTPPGQDTLIEEEEKKHFFELLEKGRGSSLDYSELNHQLDGSIKSTDRMMTVKTLKTIDEDITPHISDDSSSDDSIIISDNIPITSNNNNVLLSSASSSMSTKQSPLRSREVTPSSSVQKLIPIISDTLNTVPSSLYNKRKPNTTTTNTGTGGTNSEELTNIIPVVNESLSNELHDNSTVSSSSTTSDIVLPSPNRIASDHLSSLLPIKPVSSTNELLHQLRSPPVQDSTGTSLKSKHSPKRHSISPTTCTTTTTQGQLSTIREQPLIQQMSSQSIPSQVITKSPSSLNDTTSDQSLITIKPQTLSTTIKDQSFSGKHTTVKEQSLSTVKEQPLTTNTTTTTTTTTTHDDSTIIQRQSKSLPSIAAPITSNDECIPIASSTTMPLLYTSSTLLPTSTGITNSHQDLMRNMTVEELTSSSHNIMNKRDTSLPTSPVTITDELLRQQVHQWKQSWENEKVKVKLKEEEIKEYVRREEKLQLEYGQQIQTLRGELLEQRAKLRKVEMEKSKSHSTSGTEEQERLIQGYQKENERLYSELTLSNREMKSMKSKLLEDTNKLATELANMRDKHESQEEIIRHLRHQIESSSLDVLHHSNKEDMVPSIKLQESIENCQKLQKQIDHLLHVNQGLERQLISLCNNKESPIKETHTNKDSVPLAEVSQMKQKYEKEILLLHGKLKKLSEEHEKLQINLELALQEKDEEIKILKESRSVSEHKTKRKDESDKKGPHLIKSRTAADSRRIKDLEHQVHELQTALKTRHPNSIPALIYATHDDNNKDNEEIVSYLEKKVTRLESELTKREDEVTFKMDDMKKQFNDIEALYEEQIASLKEQLATSHNKVDVTTNKVTTNDDSTVQQENVKLKEQISQLSLELTHQRLQLEGLSAQAEGERRKSRERWEHKIKKLQKEHKERIDDVVAKLIQDRSESNIARLKSRLASREVRIKQLEDEIEINRVDSETLAVSRALEDDLRNQIDVLTQELDESRKHHTPEMHHFNSLLAKIGHLENKLSEYQRKLAETKDKTGFVSQDEMKEIERKYKRQLSAKNKQIEKFREELDSLMDTLHSLQDNCTENVVNKR